MQQLLKKGVVTMNVEGKKQEAWQIDMKETLDYLLQELIEKGYENGDGIRIPTSYPFLVIARDKKIYFSNHTESNNKKTVNVA